MFLESQLKHSVYRSLSLVQPFLVSALHFGLPLSLAWHHEAGWKFSDKQVPFVTNVPTWVRVWLHFSFFLNSVSDLFPFWPPAEFPNENLPIFPAFYFYEDNQGWPEKHNLWFFKMINGILKMWSANLYKWSYFCEEGHKIKWCYTSICIYVFLCRLGETAKTYMTSCITAFVYIF